MKTPVDIAFNSIVRKCTLPPGDLLAVLNALADAVAAHEFESVMTVADAAHSWHVQPGTAHYRIVRLHERSQGKIGRRLHGRTWIIRRNDVEEWNGSD